MERTRVLTEANITAINAALAADKRVEVIPTKDGVVVFSVQRKQIK